MSARDDVRQERLAEPEPGREPAAPQTAAAPPVERILALQATAGNQAVQRMLLQRNGPVTVPGSDRDRYQTSMTDRMLFMFGDHSKTNHQPSTGRGNFDVAYWPVASRLEITVKCHFNFHAGSAADWPDAEPEDLAWTKASSDKWKADFMKVVSDKWSAKHTFHCTREWWEDMSATVKIRFVESPDKPHYNLNVMKIPEGETRGSSVTAPSGPGRPGKTKFDSEDLRQHEKRAGRQTPALHEAGHMLGLGDEYPDDDHPGRAVAHEQLVRNEFGHGVPRTRDGRIMSNGEDIEPEHGVTFIEALRDVTKMPEWSFEARRLTPAPMPDYMDGPLPEPPGGGGPEGPARPEPPDVAFA